MGTTCSNCGAPLFFDPATQEVICRACGSSRPPEEGTVSPDTSSAPVPASTSRVRQKILNQFRYTCNSCGGQVIVSEQETSTTCIYCGSASVVPRRITEESRPDLILPFQITREQAIEKIREHSRNGFLVPKEFTSIDPETVRGVYIPYWLVDVYHAEAVVICGEKGDGENMVPFYYGRAGTVTIKDLPIESSSALRDDCSDQVGPFTLYKLKPFSADYLLGFYSDMSDISYIQLRRSIRKKTGKYFALRALMDIRAANKNILKEDHSTLIDSNLKYALFPVWFVTVNCKGKPHTILVNGETGKVVGGLPWESKRLLSIVLGGGAAIGILTGIFCSIYYRSLPSRDFDERATGFFLMMLILSLLLSTVCFLIGAVKYHSASRQLELTQDQSVFHFSKKRQGD
ncbi:MAG: hypothetical protein J5750_06680 [Clostridiales bacterium]|nr:hypothetical protein [Clostridiales bacterium]